MKCMIDDCNGEAFNEVQAIEQENNEDSDRQYKIKICDKCLLEICNEERGSQSFSNGMVK